MTYVLDASVAVAALRDGEPGHREALRRWPVQLPSVHESHGIAHCSSSRSRTELPRQPLGVPCGADGAVEVQRLPQRFRRVSERGSQAPALL